MTSRASFRPSLSATSRASGHCDKQSLSASRARGAPFACCFSASLRCDSAFPSKDQRQRRRPRAISNCGRAALQLQTPAMAVKASLAASKLASAFNAAEASASAATASGGTTFSASRALTSASVGRRSVLASSVFSLRLMLTQPRSGPLPDKRSKHKRSPTSSTSHTRAPVERRSCSCGDFMSWPSRTKMPPLSPPPTTSQVCPFSIG
mmetsp:Transcript_83094/g.185625  ORF Transcript_83094/g.185625 Transcript_83094/m.185625 type:complete len:208 (-) Transcript_83094:72-695(-)